MRVNMAAVQTEISDRKHRMTFGKFKDHTIAWVLIQQPSYIVWAHNNVEWFKVSDEILEQATEAANLERDILAADRAYGRAVERDSCSDDDDDWAGFDQTP